jgi:hypothetical protein
MPLSLRLNRRVGCGAVLLLLGATTCEGALDHESAAPGESESSASLSSKQSNLKRFAKRFRITASGPLLVEIRGGQTLALPLSAVEIELAESDGVATRARSPVVDVTVPATPSRARVPATIQADVPCAEVATRGRVPVPDVTIPPEAPDSNLPARVRVPVLDVAPLDPGMPVVATRVRVPAGQVQVPPQNVPPGSGTASAARGKPKLVAIPEISIGLLDAGDPLAATTVLVPIPSRQADTSIFVPVHLKK